MRVGLPDSFMRSASPSECAGSVDTTSTRLPAPASAAARAAAQVVLPTPPLPPKKTRRGLGIRDWGLVGAFLCLVVGLEGFDVDGGDLVIGRHREGALLRAFDLADGGKHV